MDEPTPPGSTDSVSGLAEFGMREHEGWSMVKYQQHQMNQWRDSELVHDKLHLNDQLRVRMVGAVVKHFQGELSRFGPLV